MEELEPKRIIGLMSGTSCDTIDAALCTVNPDMSCELIKGLNYDYPEFIRNKIFKAFNAAANNAKRRPSKMKAALCSCLPRLDNSG